jgi:hypothetical protein
MAAPFLYPEGSSQKIMYDLSRLVMERYAPLTAIGPLTVQSSIAKRGDAKGTYVTVQSLPLRQEPEAWYWVMALHRREAEDETLACKVSWGTLNGFGYEKNQQGRLWRPAHSIEGDEAIPAMQPQGIIAEWQVISRYIQGATARSGFVDDDKAKLARFVKRAIETSNVEKLAQRINVEREAVQRLAKSDPVNYFAKPEEGHRYRQIGFFGMNLITHPPEVAARYKNTRLRSEPVISTDQLSPAMQATLRRRSLHFSSHA